MTTPTLALGARSAQSRAQLKAHPGVLPCTGGYVPLVDNGAVLTRSGWIVDTGTVCDSYEQAAHQARDLALLAPIILEALALAPIARIPARRPPHRCLAPGWDEFDGCERCDIEDAEHVLAGEVA
jgi:hypothetical protein